MSGNQIKDLFQNLNFCKDICVQRQKLYFNWTVANKTNLLIKSFSEFPTTILKQIWNNKYAIVTRIKW